MRAQHLLLPILLAAASGVALAQTPPASAALQREETGPSSSNQKIERIVVEDSGSTVQELRVGGQTQSINVQPKNAPSYEVKPIDGIRASQVPLNARDGSSASGGSRVWNIGNF